jgi:ParB/RepB/Spo0J family partition protein
MYKIDPILLRRLTPEEIEEYKNKGKLNARYMIVDGHRRWNAAVELGWHEIRAIVTDMTLDEAREFNYKKNKIRGTVDPLREAAYFRYLRDVKKMTVDQIAEKFGISHKEVDRILSRIRVSPEARKMISEGSALTLSPTHYEILGSIPEPEKQKQMAEIIAKEELSVREAEIAKAAIEKGLPPEKTVKVVKTVKREKLAPKEAKIVVEALAKKPEAETLLELPKPKLVEEAERIVTPPKFEEEFQKLVEELQVYYPAVIVDYVQTKYKGKMFKDVVKATVFHAFWNMLTEAQREEAVQKAIKEVEEKGKFVEPPPEVLAQKILSEKQEVKP